MLVDRKSAAAAASASAKSIELFVPSLEIYLGNFPSSAKHKF